MMQWKLNGFLDSFLVYRLLLCVARFDLRVYNMMQDSLLHGAGDYEFNIIFIWIGKSICPPNRHSYTNCYTVILAFYPNG